jgi:uncharacterized phage protein (TIGR01671 family)
MREIKFRAWDKDSCVWQRMFNITSDGRFTIGNGADYSNKIILMQYTGLKDKNGKEIYEGDILKTRGGIIEKVEWSKSQSGDGFGVEAVGWIDYANTYGESVEVVGNIYENPELLN